MNNPIAAWTVRLEVDCPKCNEGIDLLDHPDFWECNPKLAIPEYATDRANNVEAVCTNCGHNFKVECIY